MPNLIAKNHDFFVKNFLKVGKSLIIKKLCSSIGVDKNGFIFPIKLFVNYFFEISNDFCFLGLIFKEKTYSDFVLIDQFGKIFGISEIFFRRYLEKKIKNNTILEKYNIKLLFPEIFNLIKNFSDERFSSKRFINTQFTIPDYFEKIEPLPKKGLFTRFLAKKGYYFILINLIQFYTLR